MSSRAVIPVFRTNFNYDSGSGGTNVTTAAWTELSSSLPADMNALEIFDSSGSVMKLGYGPAGSEQDLIYIQPGGKDDRCDCVLNKGMRLAIKAVDQNAAIGQLVITGYR